MGFNKKWLTNDWIHTTFKSKGLYGLKKELEKADAIISEKGLSSDIVDLLLESQDTTGETWDKIHQLIKKNYE